jgi:isopentenyl-diphosphate delta-isomerase
MMASAAPVSSEEDLLIVVDERDNVVGHKSKRECHDGHGVLHRAFSVFVFNSHGEVLLQKRSANKRLWGGYWSNSCCSHPRQGEDIPTAAVRRLREELGLEAKLTTLYKFTYHARFGDAGSEHELCSVLVGKSDALPDPHPEEIAQLDWVSPERLDRELLTHPEEYTPWFKMEWSRLRDEHAGEIAAQ